MYYRDILIPAALLFFAVIQDTASQIHVKDTAVCPIHWGAFSLVRSPIKVNRTDHVSAPQHKNGTVKP